LAAVVAMALVSVALGCHRTAPALPARPVLDEVRVELASPSDQPTTALDPETIRRALRDRLLATGLFAPPHDGGATTAALKAIATVGVIPDIVTVGAKGEVRARVRVRVQTRPSDASGGVSFEQEGAGSMPFRAGPGAPPEAQPRALLQRLAVRMLTDLVGDEMARRALAVAAPARLRTAIADDKGDLRAEAIRVAGERQLHELAPDLLQLLDDPDEPTRDAALGALIALRDRRAVSHLANNRSLRDRREMRKILHAMALIGGAEADDYLSFVAASHDDDDIRAEAAAAHAELARRQGDDGMR
jgi:HEAT repeat protein